MFICCLKYKDLASFNHCLERRDLGASRKESFTKETPVQDTQNQQAKTNRN